MLTGVEVIPGTIEESIRKLRELGDLVDVVKVRRHEDLRAILDAGLQYQWIVRPSSEGRNPDEVIRDALAWHLFLWEAEQDQHCIRLILSNEPNHPDSRYRGPWGADAYRREVLLPALVELGDVNVPIGLSGMVPYYGTQTWAAMLDTLPALLPAGHCYQNLGDSAGAVAECLAMAGSKDVRQLVADEVGDTNAGADPSYRADRIAEQFYGLAAAGAMAAILFPLAGYADASISYDVDTVAMILSAGRLPKPVRPKRPKQPKPEPVEVITMPTLADVQKAAYLTTMPDMTPDEVNDTTGLFKFWEENKGLLGTPVTGEISLDDGRVAQRFATGKVLVYDAGMIEVL